MQLQLTWKAYKSERLCLNLFFNELSLHMKICEDTKGTQNHKEYPKRHCSKENHEQLTHVMLSNKSKDDLTCVPKAIVLFKEKELQDSRDCE